MTEDVVAESAGGGSEIVADDTPVPFPFSTGAELLAHTRATGLPISGVMLENEKVSQLYIHLRDQGAAAHHQGAPLRPTLRPPTVCALRGGPVTPQAAHVARYGLVR